MEAARIHRASSLILVHAIGYSFAYCNMSCFPVAKADKKANTLLTEYSGFPKILRDAGTQLALVSHSPSR